mmetsp:Transcript_43612/g.100845  ORF Transcript_43612/g.100845 Transcript_43612/m.100845 type:complete len:248 (+) Transcript_43612:369-1112(+)
MRARLAARIASARCRYKASTISFASGPMASMAISGSRNTRNQRHAPCVMAASTSASVTRTLPLSAAPLSTVSVSAAPVSASAPCPTEPRSSHPICTFAAFSRPAFCASASCFCCVSAASESRGSRPCARMQPSTSISLPQCTRCPLGTHSPASWPPCESRRLSGTGLATAGAEAWSGAKRELLLPTAPDRTSASTNFLASGAMACSFNRNASDCLTALSSSRCLSREAPGDSGSGSGSMRAPSDTSM